MDKQAALQPGPAELQVLARLGGIEAAPEHLAAIGPAIEGFYASVARLRELDLRDVEPAVIFRARQG